MAPVPAAAPVAAVRFVDAADYARDRFAAESALVDNRFLPMPPGTQHVYEGVVTEDGEQKRHRVVTTFTGLTKVIDGVAARVLLDQDYSAVWTGTAPVEGATSSTITPSAAPSPCVRFGRGFARLGC